MRKGFFTTNEPRSFLEDYCDRLDTAFKRHHYETTLRVAKKLADQANHAKTQFMAHMSHELRTPLNAIIGFSELLSGDEATQNSKERISEYANQIHDAGSQLLTIVNDVLLITSFEAGQLELQLEPLDPQDIVHAALTALNAPNPSIPQTIVVDVKDGLDPVIADQRHFTKVLVNLLSNSIKFTPDTGQIRVGAEQESDEAVSFFVEDTGIGMNADEVSVALKPFMQLDHYMIRERGGAGLGLPIAKLLCEALGGELIVISEKDYGTRATAQIPTATAVVLKTIGNENLGLETKEY